MCCWKIRLLLIHLKEYGKGKDLYAWHIKNLDIFSEPMKLGELLKHNKIENAKTGWFYKGVTKTAVERTKQREGSLERYKISKAPQSYMYVYVREVTSDVD